VAHQRRGEEVVAERGQRLARLHFDQLERLLLCAVHHQHAAVVDRGQVAVVGAARLVVSAEVRGHARIAQHHGRLLQVLAQHQAVLGHAEMAHLLGHEELALLASVARGLGRLNASLASLHRLGVASGLGLGRQPAGKSSQSQARHGRQLQWRSMPVSPGALIPHGGEETL
jgi:hypothetical protein